MITGSMTSYIHEHACSGIVTVIVGPEGKPFFFHKSLLCEKSPWFRAQLHNQMTEDTDSAVELSPIETSLRDFQQSQRKVIYRYEDDVHTFNQFFNWIYGSVYAIPRRDLGDYNPATHISEWIMLHTLAVEMGVIDLAHKALKEYVYCRDTLRIGYWLPLYSEIQFIYKYRATTNDLRNLVVEKFRRLLFSIRFDGINKQLSTLCLSHPDFNADILQEIQRHAEHAEFCDYDDCSMHISYKPETSGYTTSPDPYFEVESPPRESEDLDGTSDLALNDAAPPLTSDHGSISPEEDDEEEEVYSEREREEAMADYHESRDIVMSFDQGNVRSILN
ncbi:hypothetical protein DSL72_005295 [Monilinia vaccinii-corymbosi]|uniref:BTB domain-containing protein n=1 Tax=Monilinia vaccinii-corymbosi TaxID=61207 RepID=A0A8A3PF97_9HELO|nr:hypothetical protein DSL72_005295 [Monilinia vaccinii-corymbosi]